MPYQMSPYGCILPLSVGIPSPHAKMTGRALVVASVLQETDSPCLTTRWPHVVSQPFSIPGMYIPVLLIYIYACSIRSRGVCRRDDLTSMPSHLYEQASSDLLS